MPWHRHIIHKLSERTHNKISHNYICRTVNKIITIGTIKATVKKIS